MSEIKNGRLGLYDDDFGFKELTMYCYSRPPDAMPWASESQ